MAGTPPTIQRQVSIKNDATSSGSDYDTLVAGAIPDCDGMFFPAQSDNLDKQAEFIERNDEMRGVRAATPRLPFKQRPQIEVGARAYASVLRQLVRRNFGQAGSVTGAGPYTEAFVPQLSSPSVLPACHVQLVRDNLNHKLSGAYLARLGLDFPIDGDGTFSALFKGLYQKTDVAAPPAASFTGLSENPFMLMRGQVFVDGSGTALDNLEGFSWFYDHNLPEPHFQPNRNVIYQSIGSPAKNRWLWFPQHYRLNSLPDTGYTINFGQGSTAQELAHDFGQIQKFVFEAVADPITPSGYDLIRITLFAGVHGDGGPEAGTARDDLSSGYSGNAFYSSADAKDVQIEFVKQASGATALV